MFFSLACGGETPSGPSQAYIPRFQMQKDKSPNPSRMRLSRIFAPSIPSPPAAQHCLPTPRRYADPKQQGRGFVPWRILPAIFFSFFF